MARRLAAIVFTDLAGYTALTQANEPGALRLLQELRDLSSPVLGAHHGRQVKSIGDGTLIEFPNALDAVEGAVDLQRHVHERNALKGTDPIHLRVGIHLGDVQEDGTDILGDAVNIASRIEPLADPGGICLSEPVHVQVHNKVGYRFERLGPRNLKGVQEPMEIYRVVLPWASREAAPAGPGSPRLAVLPLANISQDAKDEYLADGLTEELISALAQIKGLRVISHTSVNQYKGSTKPVGQIGSELGAGWVLEGSVRRAGDQLRMSVQLIDARSDEHLWAESYDRKLENVFSVQADVAARTAESMRLTLAHSARDSLRTAPTPSPAAWDSYLKGVYFSTQEGPKAFEEAFRSFEAATRQDPSFGLAYAQWARLHALAGGWFLPAGVTFPRAKELIARAQELAPDSPETLVASGLLALKGDLDWKAAETDFLAAIALNPSDAEARFWYAVTLFTTGRFRPSADEFRKTIQLDPQNTNAWDWLVGATFWSGDPESAVTLAELQRDRDPSSAANHGRLAMWYGMAGRRSDARKEAAQMTGPISEFVLWARAAILAELGEPQEARAVLAVLEERAKTSYVPLVLLYSLYASLGENERALQLVERDELEGDRMLWWTFWAPTLDGIRNDPRFVAWLRRRRLPEVKPTTPPTND